MPQSSAEYAEQSVRHAVRAVIDPAVHIRSEMGIVRTACHDGGISRILGESTPRKSMQCGRTSVSAFHVGRESALYAHNDARRIILVTRSGRSGEKKDIAAFAPERRRHGRFQPEYRDARKFGAKCRRSRRRRRIARDHYRVATRSRKRGNTAARGEDYILVALFAIRRMRRVVHIYE